MAGVKDRVRVLLVDDHPVVRHGLRTMLDGEEDIEVVGEASSGEEALEHLEEMRPNVVLMDIRMPGIGGIEATRRLKEAYPATSVIMLTIYDSEVYVVEAVRSGAAGYLTKDSSRELVCHAIRAVVDGGTLVRSTLLRQAIDGLRHEPQQEAAPTDSSVCQRLTPREMAILALVVQGHSNKGIAAELSLAEVTVKKHVQSIMGKLGVSDRTQAAVLGVRLGLVG